MNCPICNKELQLPETYCPECGFEMHIYPPELKSYEGERIKKYKEFYNNFKKNEETLECALAKSEEDKKRIAQLEKEIKDINATPKQEPVAGYIVIKENTEDKVVGVLSVFFGINYYGKKPSNHENAHSERISVKCKGLCEEHFSIEVTDKEVTGKLLDGDWIIGLSNHDSSITLEHRDGFKIDNLTFTFIGK